MRSLRRHLLAWLLPPLVIVGAIAASGAYVFLESRLIAAYDLDLSDIARALIPYLRARNENVSLAFNPEAEAVLRADSVDQIFYAVIVGDQLIAGDPKLPRPPHGATSTPQFWNDTHLGQRIRAVTLLANVGSLPVQIVAAETLRKRDRASRDVLLSAVIPAVLLSLVAISAVILGVGRGLGPVESLRRQLQARSPVDLRPLEERNAVDELRPLVQELNAMLARLQGAQSLQARFIANAAHQLRTPIAGLVTQLDLAKGDHAQREVHLAHAREGAARIARLAQQILSLAAADPSSNPTVPEEACDLEAIVKEHAGPWLRAVHPRGVEIEFDLAPAPFHGNAVLAGELAANLVDNAARYGAKTVKVTTRRDGAFSVLEVSDDGPGIPLSERVRIFERFRRLDNESTEGSGLGLAIVNEIAQRHRAAIEVSEAPGGTGTRITVSFPVL